MARSNTYSNSEPTQIGGKLNLADIRPGDILLYRPLNENFIQRKISAATNSPYTHAAICIKSGTIAESVAWPYLIGVRKKSLKESLKGSLCVGVLRSQFYFSCRRENELASFVNESQKIGALYNLIAVLNFKRNSSRFFEDQLSFIRNNYGKITPKRKFAKMSFFCSAFVVACYCVVGIIHESAQVAYKPKHFCAAELYRDSTFGWLLGYLVPEGGSIPDDDPLLVEATQWSEHLSDKWWS